MSAAGGPSNVQHSWLAHEEVLRNFESAWQSQAEPLLTDFLPPPNSADRAYVLTELIKIDLEQRWRTGRGVLLEDYLARFPELTTSGQFPAELVREEVRARAKAGKKPTKEEMLARFPAHAGKLDETSGPRESTRAIGRGSRSEKPALDCLGR